MIDKKDITGIILAGGKGSRMDKDKGFIELNGKPFITYSISAIKPLASRILIVSNNPDYDQFNFIRVEDIIKESGPLAGIYSGLMSSNTEYNLVLSCDIPLIKTDVLEKLIAAQDGNSDIIQIESIGKPMPLITLYNRQCKTIFYKLLQNDERRLHIALSQCKVKNVILDFENELFTTNINAPEELNLIANVDNN